MKDMVEDSDLFNIDVQCYIILKCKTRFCLCDVSFPIKKKVTEVTVIAAILFCVLMLKKHFKFRMLQCYLLFRAQIRNQMFLIQN